jgi:hypothetical protein
METHLDLDPSADYGEVFDRVKEMRSIRTPCKSAKDVEREKEMREMKEEAIAQGIDIARKCPICFSIGGKPKRGSGVREIDDIWTVVKKYFLRNDRSVMFRQIVDLFNETIAKKIPGYPEWTVYELYLHLRKCDQLAPVMDLIDLRDFMFETANYIRENKVYEQVTIGNIPSDHLDVNDRNLTSMMKIVNGGIDINKYLIHLVTLPSNNFELSEYVASGGKMGAKGGGGGAGGLPSGKGVGSGVSQRGGKSNSTGFLGQTIPANKSMGRGRR